MVAGLVDLKCLVVNYKLTLLDVSRTEAVFRKERFMDRHVNVLWSEDVYILDIGFKEHLRFQKELAEILLSFRGVLMCESLCLMMEYDLMQLINKYTDKGCIYSGKEQEFYFIRHYPKTVLVKEHLFDEYSKVGRFI